MEVAMKTSWETVKVDQSSMGLYIAQPDGPGPFPAIIVGQNQDGVGAFTQEMTRRIAAAGYLGIAPQFYHREGEPKTPEDTANFKHTRRDVNVLNDLTATINFLKGCATVDCSKLGIVGFCMGGRIAVLAAAATKSFKAAVFLYGGGTHQQWGERPAPATTAADIPCPIQIGADGPRFSPPQQQNHLKPPVISTAVEPISNGANGPLRQHLQPIFLARSRAISVSSIKTRRLMRCASSTPS